MTGEASSPRQGAVYSHLQRTMETALHRKVARAPFTNDGQNIFL
jgi:hypothetical protein